MNSQFHNLILIIIEYNGIFFKIKWKCLYILVLVFWLNFFFEYFLMFWKDWYFLLQTLHLINFLNWVEQILDHENKIHEGRKLNLWKFSKFTDVEGKEVKARRTKTKTQVKKNRFNRDSAKFWIWIIKLFHWQFQIFLKYFYSWGAITITLISQVGRVV